MLKKIDHIGIAVEDLQEGIRLYGDILGFEFKGMETVEEQGVQIAKMALGHLEIELLSPISDQSPVARFIAKRGPGIHHIAFHVEDIEAAVDALRRKGVDLTSPDLMPGSGDSQVIFIHPKSAQGVLLEMTSGKKPD